MKRRDFIRSVSLLPLAAVAPKLPKPQEKEATGGAVSFRASAGWGYMSNPNNIVINITAGSHAEVVRNLGEIAKKRGLIVRGI